MIHQNRRGRFIITAPVPVSVDSRTGMSVEILSGFRFIVHMNLFFPFAVFYSVLHLKLAKRLFIFGSIQVKKFSADDVCEHCQTSNP